jgi:hypothetical protein
VRLLNDEVTTLAEYIAIRDRQASRRKRRTAFASGFVFFGGARGEIPSVQQAGGQAKEEYKD